MDHPGLTQAGHFLSDPVIPKLRLRHSPAAGRR
jgi:hypothetical protein